jgi:hypothetical protein
MRVRRGYLLALGVVLAGLLAVLLVPAVRHRLHERARDEGHRISQRVATPADATPLEGRVCGFGPPLRCFHLDRGVDAVTDELAVSLRAAADREPHRECYDSVIRTRTDPLPARDCVLRVDTGFEHGVMVQVQTHLVREGPRAVSADGTQFVVTWY